ncbi:hypothetical protein [Jannaschia seohaensis]|uniref:Type IV pilus biogenesis protein PilP n=1 Tax=Jannaschia seohaensis TaxID=475081 RepID=A0A2Y9AAW4_9RHOB|nr:hypothetical protein [Jannaschia seohaensis]PWJ21010.1 hypothetical protein BCF38_102257 [Jannaschia seohaensis]SSA41420.1 hypothetical protein SAMN05421539_102257 [Jannaschia seohaensis]
MTPQIALDLTLDTITVLSRAPEGGWWREGTVRLTDPDMPERLAQLRDVAERRVGADFVSVLVLPDSQLLYTSLERDDRRPDETIRSLLKGRTPYDVADLTWDYVERGDRLQVAVVALDTLMEAESFAAEYGFRPVAVAANPNDPAYPGIPSFGKTGLAGDLLAGDTLELMIEDGFRAVPAPPLPEPVEESATPDSKAAPAEEAPIPFDASEDAAQDVAETEAPAPPSAEDAPLTFRPTPPTPDQGAASDPADTPGFVSTRAAAPAAPTPPEARAANGDRLARITPRLTATPALGAGRDAPPLPTPADIEAQGTRGARYPISTSRPAEPPMTASPSTPPRFDAPKKSAPAEDAPPPQTFDAPKKNSAPTIEDSPGRTGPKALKAPPVAPPGSFAAHLKRRATDPDAVAEWEEANARRKAEGGEAAKTPAPAPDRPKRYQVAPEDAPASLAARIKRRAEEQRAQEAAAPNRSDADPKTPSEAESLALPGIARAQAAEARGGARLGLMLTLGLLAILILVGLGATLLGDDAATAQEETRAPAAGAVTLLPTTPDPSEEREIAALPAVTVAPAEASDPAALLPEPGSVTTGRAGPAGISAPTPIETPLLARSLPEDPQSEEHIQASVAPGLAQPPSFETAPTAETTPAVFIGIWKADGDFDAPDRIAPPAIPGSPVVEAALDPALSGPAMAGLPTVATAPDPLTPRRNPPPVELIESRDAALGLTPATREWTVLPTGYALLRGQPAALPRPRPGGAAEARLAALAAQAEAVAPEPTQTETVEAERNVAADATEATLDAVADIPAPSAPASPAFASLATAALDRLAAPEEAEITLVAATTEGTLAPGGYTVLQGRPATLPLRRPETEAETSAAPDPASPEPNAAEAETGPPEPAPEGVVAPGGFTLLEGRPDAFPAPRPEDGDAAATDPSPEAAPLQDATAAAEARVTEAALIAPSEEGVLAPGGYTLLLGRPETLPAPRPVTEETSGATDAPELVPSDTAAPEVVQRASVDATSDLVAPTPEGVLAPGGYTLQLGRPDTMPARRAEDSEGLTAAEAESEAATESAAGEDATPEAVIEDSVLRRVRPVARPDAIDAAAAAQAAALAAEAEAEEAALAALRRTQPRPRPASIAEEATKAAIASARAATEQAAIDAAQQAAAASLASVAADSTPSVSSGPVSVLALAASERPRTRPRHVEREAARIVSQRSQVAAAASAATTQPRQQAATRVDRGSPPIRSAGGNVERAATERNVLRLNQTNLIGVYGRANARRALVRLSNGRYVKVEVGDRLDRGRVTAIGEDRLQYQRGGRNVVLELPRG